MNFTGQAGNPTSAGVNVAVLRQNFFSTRPQVLLCGTFK